MGVLTFRCLGRQRARQVRRSEGRGGDTREWPQRSARFNILRVKTKLDSFEGQLEAWARQNSTY
jgi:hypothetical protein